MKHTLIALVLALTMLSWGQTSSKQKSETGSPEATAGCCHKMADMKDGACCNHKEAASESMPCCAGKDSKSCMKDGKEQSAGSCCKGEHANSCEHMSSDSGDKGECCAAGHCGMNHNHGDSAPATPSK
jgi:hypothetical protein